MFSRKPKYPGLQVVRQLGSGGQANVYLAKQTGEAESFVALKVFEDGIGVVEYQREVSLLLRVGDHPNIVKLRSFHGHKKRPALVTDYIDGCTLSDCIDDNGAFSVPHARHIAAGIASAVHHMHTRGVVHRDLKTANVMLDVGGGDGGLEGARPVIIDLGIGAKRGAWHEPDGIAQLEKPRDRGLHEVDDVTVGIKGTRDYMAPEMLRCQRWSEKTDTYAFGIVLWELLTGEFPMRHTGVSTNQAYSQTLRGERPDLAAVERVAGHQLTSLIAACWSHDPEHRPTMFQVLRMLRRGDGVAIFRQMDLTNSGSLGFGEFVHLCDTYAPGAVPRAELHRVFAAVNRSGCGRVSFSEWTYFFWDNVTAVNAGWAGDGHVPLENTLPDALYALQCMQESQERAGVGAGAGTWAGGGRSRITGDSGGSSGERPAVPPSSPWSPPTNDS